MIRRNKIILMVLLVFLIGCNKKSDTLTGHATIISIGPTLEEIKSNYNAETVIQDDHIYINNTMVYQGNTAKQSIKLKLNNNNNVVSIELESDTYNGETLLFSDHSYKDIDVNIPSNIKKGTEYDYINHFNKMNIDRTDEKFKFNFDKNLEPVDNYSQYKITKNNGIIFLHLKENIENLHSDVKDLLDHSGGKENLINELFDVFMNHPDISIKSFAEKDLLEIYSYLIKANDQISDDEVKLDFTYGIYFSNIIKTLSNLSYIIDSPMLLHE